MDTIQNKIMLVLALFIVTACNSEDHALRSYFGSYIWFLSNKTYVEKKCVPLTGDGYKYIHFSIPPKETDRIEKDSTNYFKKGFTRIEKPIAISQLGAINSNDITTTGIFLEKDNEYLIVDYEKNVIEYLVLF
ncbi:MAG: hypothetical protein IJU63_04030 [Bacteroidales bacterium]|nr:hypothetical protein [Bacteroidales bacterium]